MGTAGKTKESVESAGQSEKTQDHGHGHKEKAAPPAPKKGGWTPAPDGCNAVGCKSKSARFSFCSEHYEQFKFGLITKKGEPALDYEKKFEQYQRMLVAQKGKPAQKVA
jgi:hypothetical protein